MKIVVRHARRDGYARIDISGHEPNSTPGLALICCAVSTLVQGCIVALIALSGQFPDAIEVVDES